MNRRSYKSLARQESIKILRYSSYPCKYHQRNKSSLLGLVLIDSKNHSSMLRQSIFGRELQVQLQHLKLSHHHEQNELQEGITIRLLCVQKVSESETVKVNTNLLYLLRSLPVVYLCLS